MISFILILLGVAAIVATLLTRRKSILFALIPILLLLIIASSFTIVPTGYTGIRATFSQINPNPAEPGFNFKIPFVERIHLVNNKQQDITFSSKVWGETIEKTPLYATDITVSYTILPEASSWLYANITNPSKPIDEKIAASAIKSAMVQLSTEEATKRSVIEPLTLTCLQEAINGKFGANHITINAIVINNMDFEESYNAAIAERSIASQRKQTQAIENETNLQKAETEKAIALTNAQADAETKRIAAEAQANATLVQAEAQAEANRKLANSITENILFNQLIERWNGSLPTALGADLLSLLQN